jgi:hypothetical protein
MNKTDPAYPFVCERAGIEDLSIRLWSAQGDPWLPIDSAPWEYPVLVSTEDGRYGVAQHNCFDGRWYVTPDETIAPLWWCPLPVPRSHFDACDFGRGQYQIAKQKFLRLMEEHRASR